MKERIFVSSVQKELAAERQALRDYVRGDKLLSRYFEVFLFEDVPAADRHVGAVYLGEVARAAIYAPGGRGSELRSSQKSEALTPCSRSGTVTHCAACISGGRSTAH
ncbi:MAG TPA: DUF4062 domain-containing protein [Thermoanaerobaculia bacterium]|nr:DUF4062 domain-containing protein [Thermoanaerobaculia bacterium]